MQFDLIDLIDWELDLHRKEERGTVLLLNCHGKNWYAFLSFCRCRVLSSSFMVLIKKQRVSQFLRVVYLLRTMLYLLANMIWIFLQICNVIEVSSQLKWYNFDFLPKTLSRSSPL